MDSRTFEDAVTAITEKLWREAMMRASCGITSSFDSGLPGVQVTGGDTRERLRCKIHEAARRTDFETLRRLV
jgi:hypothetical protein